MRTHTLYPLLVAACIATVLAACGAPTTVHVEGTRIRLGSDGKTAELRSRDGDRAVITADGALTVDGEPVAVTPQQAALLREYHADLVLIRDHALAIAGQGVALGGKAVSETVKGLLGGNPDQIETRVEAEAEKIEAEAEKIELRADALKLKQRQLAHQLPQLRPFLPGDVEDIAAMATSDSDG